jgi:phage terminase Nu1 subunit (DNA packaging protein)
VKAISLREYARRRKAAGLTGGSLRAVQEAIANGRLDKSLTRDRKKIRDTKLANKEWAAATKADYVPITGPAAAPAIATEAVKASPASNSLAEARTRREAAQADLRELELKRHRGELVPSKDFEAHLARTEERMREVFARCRNKLLSIPTRARQRDASFTARHIALIDELIRETLLDLATPSSDPTPTPDASDGQ